MVSPLRCTRTSSSPTSLRVYATGLDAASRRLREAAQQVTDLRMQVKLSEKSLARALIRLDEQKAEIKSLKERLKLSEKRRRP